jgi:HK97 family phage major capsid protein
MEDVKAQIEALGKAWSEFKDAHAREIKEVKNGQADFVTADKVTRIDAALNEMSEAKASLEARLAAETKARELLEVKLGRVGFKAQDEAAVKDAAAFALELKAMHTERGRHFGGFDTDEFAEYKAGLGTYLREGRDGMSPDQVKAMQVGVDSEGGYLVTPDMSGRIVRRVFETSPVRQVANVVTISTDALEGIEDLNEAAAGWVGETASRPDTATPEVGRWRIVAHDIYAQPKATQKMLDDSSVNIEAWLSGKIADKLARMENAAFVDGDGVQKPKGFASYTTADDSGTGVTWGTIGRVNTGVNGAFAGSNPADKVFDLVGLLKNEYLPGAVFMTRRAVITAIRKFKDGQGQYLWQPSLQVGQPESLMGYPIARAEDIPALGTGSLSLWFGNFGVGYQIVDRAGIRVVRDPYTDKPYVKFYTTRRTGGAVVNFEAIKVMRFA